MAIDLFAPFKIGNMEQGQPISAIEDMRRHSREGKLILSNVRQFLTRVSSPR